jgi:hypothetical protein
VLVSAAGPTIYSCCRLGYTLVGNLWVAPDGSNAGSGAASTNTSSDWYHWGPANVDSMVANPTWNCTKANSAATYTYFWGNPGNYTDLKNTALYFNNATNTTSAWCVHRHTCCHCRWSCCP